MAIATNIYQKIAKALAGVGVVIRGSASSNVLTDPTITSGTGAPTAAEPNGSMYLRKDGAADTTLYKRVSGAWVAQTAGSITDAELLAIAGLVSAANKLIRFTGSGTAELIDCTAAGAALLDDAAASNQRATLGLVIGTDVQAQDAELAAIAGLASAANKLIRFTGSGTAELIDCTAAGAALLDDADAAAQRTTLGVKWWLSAELTGTGADQTVAHSAGGFPSVLIIPTAGHDGAGGAGDKMPTTTFTSSDFTDVRVTVSAGAKFKLFAIG